MKKACSICHIKKSFSDFNRKSARCKSCQKIYNAQYRKKHKARLSKKQNLYYKQNSKRLKKEAKIYRQKNKQKISKNKKLYYRKNRKEILSYKKIYNFNQYQTNIVFRLKNNLRTRINGVLRRTNWRKNLPLSKYLGCSPAKLKVHLEKQFKRGMTWENKGVYGWHIDHKIPLSSAKTIKELYRLCHYTNLRPLWALDNLKKGNKNATS